jgi:glycosyltransferase involved in cell wall biosynthesis
MSAMQRSRKSTGIWRSSGSSRKLSKLSIKTSSEGTTELPQPQIALFAIHFDVYVSSLAGALADHADVFLFVPEELARDIEDILDPRVSLRPFHKPSVYSLRMVKAMVGVVAEIREVCPDVIHLVSGGYSWLCPFLPGLRKLAPIVVTIHDVRPHPGEERLVYRVTRSITRRFASAYILHGEKLREEMISFYGVSPSSVHSVPHGELSVFKEWSRGEVPEEKDLVLWFGRVSPYKGIEYLLRAQPLLNERVPGAQLLLVGRGVSHYRDQVDDKAPVVFHDQFVPNEQIADLFNRASVVVLPYIEASQSGVLATAYGFRKPVVVTNVGGLPEIVVDGKGGFVVPPRDPLALAEKTAELLSSPSLRREMARFIDQQVCTDLSWRKIGLDTMKVYRSTIAISQ